MNSNLLQEGIVLATLEPVGSVFLVLGGNVTGHSGNTALFLLGAFEDDLHPVSFSFLCHSRKI